MKTMDISEVARVSGIPPSTLRFYEEKRLIFSSGRRGLRRLYHPNVIQRLAFITLGQRTGFSLEEIAKLCTSKGKIDRTLLVAKAKELEKKMKELRAMSRGLQHAAVCKAPNHFECPKFLRLLRISGRSRARRAGSLRK